MREMDREPQRCHMAEEGTCSYLVCPRARNRLAYCPWDRLWKEWKKRHP